MKIKIILLSLAAVTFSKNLEAAAPSISGISGTIATGQTIVITGVNFGTSTQQPLYFNTFENGTTQPMTLGSTVNFINADCDHCMGITNTGQMFGSVYSSSATSTGSAAFNADTVWATWAPGFRHARTVMDRYRGYTDPVSTNHKWLRWWPVIGVGGLNDLIGGHLGNGGRELENEAENFDSGVIGGFAPWGAFWPDNQWYQETVVFHHNGGTGLNTDGSVRECDGLNGTNNGACDGIAKIIQDGILIKDRENIFNDTTLLKQIDVAESVCVSGNNCPASGEYERYDNVYISSDVSMVVACASPTWAACTYWAVQPQSAWANAGNSITITLDIARIASTNKYLYIVTDDTGTANGVNANGFLLAAAISPQNNYKQSCPCKSDIPHPIDYLALFENLKNRSQVWAHYSEGWHNYAGMMVWDILEKQAKPRQPETDPDIAHSRFVIRHDLLSSVDQMN